MERSASDQVRARAAPVHAVETPSSGGPGTPLNPTAAPNGGGMRTLQAPVSALSPGGGVGMPVMATARRATGLPLRFRGGARSSSDSEGDGQPAPRRHPGKAPVVAVAPPVHSMFIPSSRRKSAPAALATAGSSAAHAAAAATSDPPGATQTQQCVPLDVPCPATVFRIHQQPTNQFTAPPAPLGASPLPSL